MTRTGVLKIFSRLFFVFIVSCSFSTAYSAEIEPIPEPNWSYSTPLSFDYQVPTEQLRDGIYFLLVDSQTKVDNNGVVERFRRNARHIVNPSGVEESSQINITYDPSYQKMNLHRLRIWRDGKPIDKIATARVSILQQEQELENLIYNGNETVNLVLNDIRVDDVLDYSYTIIGQNPVYSGIFSQSSYFQWTVPVLNRSVRVFWLKDKPLQIKQHSNQFEIEQKPWGNGVEYSIQRSNIQPLQSESRTPDWFDKYPSIEFSESQNWQEIVSWSVPLFDNAQSNDASILALAKKLRDETKSKPEQLIKALQYVQQEIRYLGIEIGENSHRPTSASETLQRRYGDCKDKTVLLISILRALDIEAYPALVNTTLGDELANRLPKPGAFDHVIVKAILGQDSYWLDPTRQYQNSNLIKVFQPDYNRVLVVSNITASLEKPKIEKSENYQLTTEKFTLSKDRQKSVTFKTTNIMSGIEAERNRSSLASKGLALMKTDYLDFYRGYYSDIEPAEALTFKELDNGDRESVELYSIENFWEKNEKGTRYNSWFYAYSISDYLSRENTANRKEPLAIDYPVNLKQIIDIQFEEDDWGFTNESLEESNEFFDYKKNIVYNKKKKLLTLTYSYKSKLPFVPSDKLADYDASLEKLDDDTTFGIYRNVDSADGDSFSENQGEMSTWDSYDKTVLSIIFVFVALLIISIILWRIDSKRNPFNGEMILYPVSPIKFVVLSMLTFGIYASYWFYKNFKYFKIQSGEKMMPIVRGIFDYLWFYSLYGRMVNDSYKRFEKNLLPHETIGVFLAIAYFLLLFAENISDYVILALTLATLIVLPMVFYVNRVNHENTDAIEHNSKWSLRHAIVAIISVPLLVMSMGSAIRILPADHVIPGGQILSYDLRYLQRKGVVDPGDEIEYFYSNAILFLRSDGNGFTDKYIFSYWVEENNQFQLERADYSEIEDIDVTWAKTTLDNTIVEVTLKDQSSILLFVSSEEKKDKMFVRTLKSHWNKAKTLM